MSFSSLSLNVTFPCALTRKGGSGDLAAQAEDLAVGEQRGGVGGAGFTIVNCQMDECLYTTTGFLGDDIVWFGDIIPCFISTTRLLAGSQCYFLD